MPTRDEILEITAGLLTESADGDVSTRDVCDAAGIGAPVLYRQFGDKNGLLSAVVDYGFEQYLASKRAAVPSDDPVADLRTGWDNHVAFALANPNYYKLMYSPVLGIRPAASAEAHRLLTKVVERVAAAGRLSVPVDTAANMIMSANAGVALALLYRPELYTDQDFSTRVRDAVIDRVTLADDGATPAAGLRSAAGALIAALGATDSPALSGTEGALLREWLHRLEQA
jgi:AcrR family transcriptional regulator